VARLAGTPPGERASVESELQRISDAQEALVEGARQALERLDSLGPDARAQEVLDLLTVRERIRLGDLGKALKRVRDEAARELAHLRRSAEAAVGAGLDAGVFISCGAAAEEIRIDDPVFGPVRVCIAERLNEAARGTGRAFRVASEVDEDLRMAIARTGNPQLKEPFAVHLGAEQARDPVATDIYNAGTALSGEALDAFLRATLGPRLHFERLIRRQDFAPELAGAFALPDTLRLIISVEAEAPLAHALLFRDVGRVSFRGFEEAGGCQVFELLPEEGRFARLLVEHHLARWLEEARVQPSSLLSSLRSDVPSAPAP
jgi:hypothetical protein